MTSAEVSRFLACAPEGAVRRVRAAMTEALMGWLGGTRAQCVAAAKAAVECEVIVTPNWSEFLDR